MPLTPAAQRERRQKLKPTVELESKKCKNDGKFFKRPTTGPGSTKLFCTKQCKDQFHQMGGNAFGPLKTKLEKLVKQWMRSYQQDTDQNIIAVRNRLDELAARLEGIIDGIKSANQRILTAERDLSHERMQHDIRQSSFDLVKTNLDIQRKRMDDALEKIEAQTHTISGLQTAIENVNPQPKGRPVKTPGRQRRR